MASSLKHKKKSASAEARLRRIEETLAPYRKVPTPQSKRPRNEWIPGDFVISRRGEVRDEHHCIVLE